MTLAAADPYFSQEAAGDREGDRGGRCSDKGGQGWGWVKVQILNNVLSIFMLYINKHNNPANVQIVYKCLKGLYSTA